MKININYELFEKIDEAKNGFNVHRVGKKFAITNTLMSLLSIMLTPNDPEQIKGNILYCFSVTSLQFIGMELAMSRMQKENAIDTLKDLSSKLMDLDVHTNNELLLESKAYETIYKVNFADGIIPKIIQNKYIIVPTRNEGEASLLQEHIIGTKKYALSVGEPEKQKQYRLAHNI